MVYYAEIKESVTATHKADDRIEHRIELTPVLDEASMRELLKRALEAAGFEEATGVEEEQGQMTATGEDGERIAVDLDAMTITTTLERERHSETVVVGRGHAESQGEATLDAKQHLAHELERAEQRIGGQARRLQKEVTLTLEAGEARRGREMNEVLQEVYAEALKRKAAELGDVMEIHEGKTQDGQYELVIKVSQ